MAETICAPVSWSQGVVRMAALAFFFRRRRTAVSSLAWSMFWVRERRMAEACSTWLLKNSPKFFIYTLALVASTTVTKLCRCRAGVVFCTPSTAAITSDSLPTPEGSMMMRSGA